MNLRKAQNQDKKPVLAFCKNTFSWGDYISEVWDNWELEGNLLIVEENQKPVALCHGSIHKPSKQIWIEGIRVHPDYRRRGFAWNLISRLESIGIQNNLLNSFMLIEVNNINSISLAEKLNYKKIDAWWFYSLIPKSVKVRDDLKLTPKPLDLNDELFENKMYVNSWRWLQLDKTTLQDLIQQKRILYTKRNSNFSISVFTDSEHFERTLVVTLYGNSADFIEEHLKFIQNFSSEKNYSRIQVITQLDNLQFAELQKRLSFYLMKKDLSQ